jgi:hypothetical protein
VKIISIKSGLHPGKFVTLKATQTLTKMSGSLSGTGGFSPGKSDEESTTARYNTSIFRTPFSALSNPKRVWLGEPSSADEGIGKFSLLAEF